MYGPLPLSKDKRTYARRPASCYTFNVVPKRDTSNDCFGTSAAIGNPVKEKDKEKDADDEEDLEQVVESELQAVEADFSWAYDILADCRSTVAGEKKRTAPSPVCRSFLLMPKCTSVWHSILPDRSVASICMHISHQVNQTKNERSSSIHFSDASVLHHSMCLTIVQPPLLTPLFDRSRKALRKPRITTAVAAAMIVSRRKQRRVSMQKATQEIAQCFFLFFVSRSPCLQIVDFFWTIERHLTPQVPVESYRLRFRFF